MRISVKIFLYFRILPTAVFIEDSSEMLTEIAGSFT